MGVFPLSSVSDLGLLASTSVSFSFFQFFPKLSPLCETLAPPSLPLFSSPTTFTVHPPLLPSPLSSPLLCCDDAYPWPATSSGRQFSTTTFCSSVSRPPLPWWFVAALASWIMGALPRGWLAHPHFPSASLVPLGIVYFSLVVVDLLVVVLACFGWRLLLCARSRVFLYKCFMGFVVYLVLYLWAALFVGFGLHLD
ncbi:unnamed protein product [Prunus brigantina]